MAREAAAKIALLWLGMVSAASSASGLVPSPVTTGDCVADRISIPYSIEREPFDEKYCREGNPSNFRAYQICLRNSALNDTPFFTDRCGDGTDYYLAVNGVEHVLRRVSPRWLTVNLSGRFAGGGLELEVLPLRQWVEPNETGTTSAAEDEDAASGTWLVQITLRRGSESRVFEATLAYGP
jgi:hypothetical protein